MIRKLNLKQTVLNNMIDDYIIEIDARKMGLAIEGPDLQQAIAQIKAFNKDGRFDESIYRRYLDYERLTPAEFEQKLSSELLKQRFVAVLTENITVPRYELESTFHYMNDTYDLAYLTIDSAAFMKDLQVTPDQFRHILKATRNVTSSRLGSRSRPSSTGSQLSGCQPGHQGRCHGLLSGT
jgi:peptidyl-prolyl cis-trans isomerase D